MIQETTEIQELSLEKVIDTKLVQNNVTEQVLAALKDKYSNLRLAAIDDKESYLEVKAAAKECAKLRNLTIKVCKEGREDAVRVQKLWIAKEKEVIKEIETVENPLDAEIARFDAEVQRKANEEKQGQEEAYINRQATLTKMGAKYEAGCFVLGEASFEADLVKGASQDIWDDAIVPKFQAEYEKIESVRIAEEKEKAEKEAKLRQEAEELQRKQEEFRLKQEAFQRQQEEAERVEREMHQAAERKVQAERNELHQKRFAQIAAFPPIKFVGHFADLSEEDFQSALQQAEVEYNEREAEKQQRIAEEAATKERERIAAEAKLAEEKRLREEAEQAEKLAQASDKEKYADLISKISAIHLPEMRSGQYRSKVASIRKSIEAILSL